MNSPAPRPEIPTRLLVDALVREDGTVVAEELYTVAGRLGMTDQQVRLCLRRLVAEGRFTQQGRGRKARIRAVADPTDSFAPDAEHVRYAYRQDAGLAPWDGTWHLFAFAVPETRRTARDTLRTTLLHLGAAPVQGGLYVCANPIADLVETHARALGVHESLTSLTSTDLRIGDLRDPRALAASLWPLDDLAAGHTRLATYAEQCLTELDHDSSPTRLTLAVTLAAEFDRAHTPDPLLPPQLLPEDWPGARARALTRACWQRLDAGTGTMPRLFTLYRNASD
ncbi:PaaX family transcriptional regulator C-terminal domain-containing protein [Embleya sp. NPDC008237]|uniref:PaaX family transcriptional regulator C-terminal domain-containing protein n=1 Tax=Embleya sp. NPDC008237 TaxID=3363978 RepID=UPI0036E3E067